jgi:nitroreductase
MQAVNESVNKETEIVDRAITSRRSIRRFLPTPVAAQTVRDILSVASCAPSGTNMQPWRVYVLGGERKETLSKTIVDAHDAGLLDPSVAVSAEYEYYPKKFPEPFLSRRRKVGWDLYGSLGIAKGDTARMHEQHARNYRFFDAPVGMICTIERSLEIGSWLDYGMFLQNICIAARARGLDTCPQAAFAKYHKIIREQLSISETEVVVCGMALGYADMNAPENLFPVERVPVDEFAVFCDLD